MIKAGITGGIGSGKSTVCKIFEVLGVPIYYADDRAKYLMQHDEQLKAELIAAFGEEIYEGGVLQRKVVANKVFNDKTALEKLNSLVHPAVYNDALAWMDTHKDAVYTLKEAALLFEAGSYQMLDKIITVYAPEEVRLERVIQRDGVSRDEVLARMNNQWPDEKKKEMADYVIHNYAPHSLIEQVMKIHEELVEISN